MDETGSGFGMLGGALGSSCRMRLVLDDAMVELSFGTGKCCACDEELAPETCGGHWTWSF